MYILNHNHDEHKIYLIKYKINFKINIAFNNNLLTKYFILISIVDVIMKIERTKWLSENIILQAIKDRVKALE